MISNALYIRLLMKDLNVTKLAQRLGLSIPCISMTLSGRRRNPLTIARIEAVLDIKLSDYIPPQIPSRP